MIFIGDDRHGNYMMSVNGRVTRIGRRAAISIRLNWRKIKHQKNKIEELELKIIELGESK